MFKNVISAAVAVSALTLVVPPEDALAAGEDRTSFLPEVHRAQIRLPGSDQPREVAYEIIDGYAILEGDIILGRVDDRGRLLKNDFTPQGVVVDSGRWTNGIVPFVIDKTSVTDDGERNIRDAIAHWAKNAPINFVPRGSQGDYVAFVRGSSPGACSSWVGRAGGKQEIKLAPSGNCSKGALIHEIGHAVGFYHEQSREDRDKHVTIMRDNIQSGRGHNFDKHVSGATDIGPYDFNSIMHYGAYDFCKRDKNGSCVGPTIVTKPPGIPIGQRTGLSQGDIGATLRIYNIVKHPRFLADVSGDGKKDIVAFGNDGVYVSLSTGAAFAQPQRWSDSFSHNNGRWRHNRHLRLLGDINGDGKDDVVGFGDAGVYVSLSTGTGFGEIQFVVAEFGYNSGWRLDTHPRYLADVNGDGKKDVVGFSDEGVWVSFSTGLGFAAPQFLINDFGYVSGWRVERHPRYLADVNGDGKQDVLGFGDAGIYLSLSEGTGFGQVAFVVADYGYDTGWRVERHPRYLADINGDGKQDIVGFGDAGVYRSLSEGATFGPATFVRADYGYDSAWRVENHPRLLADVNGDGKQDIVGFGDAGVYLSLADGTGGFGEASFVLADFGYDSAWRVNKHPRFVGDVSGDGKQDIVGIGDAGVYVSLFGTSFGAAEFWINKFGYDDGWR
jgi:Astacin (Peptidase family M12A)/FG-GAP-like repeat